MYIYVCVTYIYIYMCVCYIHKKCQDNVFLDIEVHVWHFFWLLYPIEMGRL